MSTGDVTRGDYKVRDLGSVIPCLRWRTAADDAQEAPGVIRHAFLSRITPDPSGTDPQPSGTDPEWIGNGKTPVGNGWDGWDGSNQPRAQETSADPLNAPVIRPIGDESPGSVPSVPSIPRKGSCRSASIPDPSPIHSAPSPDQGQPVLVDGQPGWRLPGVMPRGSGPTVPVLLVDPNGNSRQVQRSRITTPSPAPLPS